MEKRLKFTSFYEGPVPVYTRSVTPLFLAALLAPSSTSLLDAIVDPLPLGHHVNVHVTCLLPVSLQEVLLRSQVTPGQVQPVSWIIVIEDVVPFVQKSGEDSLLLGLFVSVIGRYGLEV